MRRDEETVLTTPGLSCLAVHGGSMRPLLRSGDMVAVENPPAVPVRPGDLILYSVGGNQFVHRVGFRTGTGAWIFDDAAVVGWHRVHRTSILGKVIHPSPLSRGWLGLLYGLAVSLLFLAGRPLKTALSGP